MRRARERGCTVTPAIKPFTGENKMQKWGSSFVASLGLVTAVGMLSGCAAGLKIPLKDPAPSSVAYAAPATPAPTPLVLTFKDGLAEAGRTNLQLGSVLNPTLESKGAPFNAVPWVATHTTAELKARGVPTTLGDAGTLVTVKQVRIQNQRANGYAPLVTFTSAKAEVVTPQGPRTITAYIKRAKVPVWSFDEVIEPAYNDPLSLLTKELAAKLNQQLVGQSITDAQVETLVAAIRKDGATRADAYLDVYQLGFGNNRSAVPELVKLTTHSSEYVRLAALSSLGILKATDQYAFLVARYESRTGLWQDRAMALKAVGDLGTPEALEYLRKEQETLRTSTEKESRWNRDIIELYL